MEADPAGQIEKFVAIFAEHPVASFFAVLAVLLILGFSKGGLFSKILDLLTERARSEAVKEQRRIEMLRMLEDRPQVLLPGIEDDER